MADKRLFLYDFRMQKIVMVVEDDPVILTMVAGILESRGYRVLKAESGSEAIMTAVNSVPDIVVTDINMPSGYGSSLYHKLQQEENTRNIPFIFITGIPPDQAKKLVPESPRAVLLTKPFDVKRLVTLVEELLSHSNPA